MSNITGKINLAALEHTVRKLESGEEVIILPIGRNKLFKSDKGNVYLDLIAFDLKNPEKDRTHMVKQSVPKADLEKMNDEEKASIPILGNLRVWSDSPNESAPNTVEDQPGEGLDDLPF